MSKCFLTIKVKLFIIINNCRLISVSGYIYLARFVVGLGLGPFDDFRYIRQFREFKNFKYNLESRGR